MGKFVLQQGNACKICGDAFGKIIAALGNKI